MLENMTHLESNGCAQLSVNIVYKLRWCFDYKL